MSVVFADTFFLLARSNRQDPAHAKALAFSRHTRVTYLTTAWVVTEVADALAKERAEFRRIYEDILGGSAFKYIPATQELLEVGIAFYHRYTDKEWPLTDCISFVVMHDEGIRDALTADHHFEQAGFRALLKP